MGYPEPDLNGYHVPGLPRLHIRLVVSVLQAFAEIQAAGVGVVARVDGRSLGQRLDVGRVVLLDEIGERLAARGRVSFSYGARRWRGDDAVGERGGDKGEKSGDWEHHVCNKFASSDKKVLNGLVTFLEDAFSSSI